MPKEPKKEEKKEEKPKEEPYGLVKVATETELVIQDKEGFTFNKEAALCEILNKLHKIEKALG